MLKISKPLQLLLLALAVVFSLQSLPAIHAAKSPKDDGIGPQVTHDLDRSSTSHPLQQDTKPYCSVTPLRVDSEAYKGRCEASKGPCFDHVGDTLKGTLISPWLEPLNMTDEVLLADDSAQGKPDLHISSAETLF